MKPTRRAGDPSGRGRPAGRGRSTRPSRSSPSSLGFRLDAILPCRRSGCRRCGRAWPAHPPAAWGDWSSPGCLRLRCVCLGGGWLFLRATELIAPNGTRIELDAWDPPLECLLRDRPSWSRRRGGDSVGDRPRGHALSRSRPGSTGRAFHRLAHPHPGWRPGARLRAFPPDPVPDDLLLPGLGPRGIRRPGPALRDAGRRLRAPAPAASGTACSRARPGSRSSRSPVRPSTRPWPTWRWSCRRRAGAPIASSAGQRFVRHQAAEAVWGPGRVAGFEARDLGIAAATAGLASAQVARRAATAPPASPSPPPPTCHEAEFLFTFVLAGAATLTCDGHGAHRLGPRHAFVVPPRLSHALSDCSRDLELLEVALPAGFRTQVS